LVELTIIGRDDKLAYIEMEVIPELERHCKWVRIVNNPVLVDDILDGKNSLKISRQNFIDYENALRKLPNHQRVLQLFETAKQNQMSA